MVKIPFSGGINRSTQLNYIALRALVLMLAPMAPHIASEMWSLLVSCKILCSQIDDDPTLNMHARQSEEWLGDSTCSNVLNQRWPRHVEELRKKDEIVVAIQIGGKMRGTISVPAELGEDNLALERLARGSSIGIKYLNGKRVKRVIIPPKISQPIISFVLD